MKPTNLKSINKSKGQARVKILIRAHLYWFNGFPYINNEKLYWCCPDIDDTDKEALVINAKMISRAHRVINELRRDYQVALPRVVGNVEEWQRRCKSYLEFTKSLISDHSSIIESLFDKDDTFKKKLKDNFDKKFISSKLGIAISWMHYVNQTDLVKALKFILSYRDYILSKHQYNIIQLSKLCHIYILDASKSSAFVKMHLNPNSFATNTKNGCGYLEPFIQYKYKKNKKFKFPAKPEDNTSKTLSKSINWLLKFNSNQRKRVFLILDAIEINSFIDAYQFWWREVDNVIAKVSNLINYPDVNKSALLKSLQNSLKGYHSTFPGKIDISNVLSAIKCFSKNEMLTKVICQFFNRYDTYNMAKPLKPILLIYFNDHVYESGKGIKYITEYIKAFSNYISNDCSSNKLAAWGKFSSRYWASCESRIFYNLNISQLNQFFNVLRLINKEKSQEIRKDWIKGIEAYPI